MHQHSRKCQFSVFFCSSVGCDVSGSFLSCQVILMKCLVMDPNLYESSEKWGFLGQSKKIWKKFYPIKNFLHFKNFLIFQGLIHKIKKKIILEIPGKEIQCIFLLFYVLNNIFSYIQVVSAFVLWEDFDICLSRVWQLP